MRSRAAAGRKVLIDTGGFFAFADADDARHADAAAIFAGLRDPRAYRITTSFIVAETHALWLNRLRRRAASAFLQDTEDGTQVVVEWVTANDVRRGREIV